MPRSELERLLREGHPVAAEEIAGAGYRGVSLNLPRVVERVTWTTFQKVFVRDRDGVRGYNVRVEQRGVQAASVARQRRGRPWIFGHFRVRDGRASRAGSDRGLLLDYGAFAGRLDPLRPLRDPVVSLRAGSTDLLLGWSYLDLGPLCVPTPSFFTLERESEGHRLEEGGDTNAG